MPTYTEPKNLVISAGVLKNGSDVFNILDPDSGGSNTFSVALSADGAEPATHWGARSPLEVATFDALTNMTTQQFKTYVDARATELGRTPVGPITAFKNNLQIGDGAQDFWAFVAGLGLQAVASAS